MTPPSFRVIEIVFLQHSITNYKLIKLTQFNCLFRISSYNEIIKKYMSVLDQVQS